MRLWGDYAVGMVKDWNWLQHWENVVDPYHLLMLTSGSAATCSTVP